MCNERGSRKRGGGGGLSDSDAKETLTMIKNGQGIYKNMSEKQAYEHAAKKFGRLADNMSKLKEGGRPFGKSGVSDAEITRLANISSRFSDLARKR